MGTELKSPPATRSEENLGADLDEQAGLKRQRILVVDDEPDTVYLLKRIVRTAGFDVFSARSGGEAIRKCKEMGPDLVLLDIMMPEMDGWETLRFIREMTDIPVIMVSAIGMKEEIVHALQIGVDDYLTKPFFNAEVVARIKAVLRRTSHPEPITRFIFPQAKLVIDTATQEVFLDKYEIQLTPKEFAVLAVLAKSAPAIVNYSKISQAVWGEDSEEAHKRTKYLIYLLRRKLAKIEPNNSVIQNIDRLGYKLQTEGS
jgi:DNA-binding response OmpR family regulator